MRSVRVDRGMHLAMTISSRDIDRLLGQSRWQIRQRESPSCQRTTRSELFVAVQRESSKRAEEPEERGDFARCVVEKKINLRALCRAAAES